MEDKKITKYRLDFGWQKGWNMICKEYHIVKETEKTITYKDWCEHRISKTMLDVFKRASSDSKDMKLITLGSTTKEQFIEMCKKHIETIVEKYQESYEDMANAQKIFLDRLITEGSGDDE